MFQIFIFCYNLNFFFDKLVFIFVILVFLVFVLQIFKVILLMLYFDSLMVNVGNGGFFYCIQMDIFVNVVNQVVFVGVDIVFDVDFKFFVCLVCFEFFLVLIIFLIVYDVYFLDGCYDGGYYIVKDCVIIDVFFCMLGNNVYVGFMVWFNFIVIKCCGLVLLNQVIKEIICFQLFK